MPHLFVFGMGYSAARLAERLSAQGWSVAGTTRSAGPSPERDRHPDEEGRWTVVPFDDERAFAAELARATHILSSIPPEGDADPVLSRYASAIAAAPARWVGYLSSTGVYGDAAGAWIDESAPIGRGRRTARAAADRAWAALRGDVRVFRLPGIYGPGRSALDRVTAGRAHRVDLAGQIFSRIHVDDIAGAIEASFAAGPPGAYNIADELPASQNAVIEHACALLGLPLPALLALGDPRLPPAAAAFYAENRRVANGKAKRLLGWRPVYSDYRAGLLSIRARNATTSPTSASRPPSAASIDQR